MVLHPSTPVLHSEPFFKLRGRSFDHLKCKLIESLALSIPHARAERALYLQVAGKGLSSSAASAIFCIIRGGERLRGDREGKKQQQQQKQQTWSS